VKVAFDGRPVSDPNGVGRYTRCLLKALRQTAAAGDEVLETQRPSSTLRSGQPDLVHSPWIAGAMLHPPCPLVVTVHDLATLKRPSELLRTGLRLRLRHLAVQRAACVIAPTEAVAEDAVTHLRVERGRMLVIAEAADTVMYRRTPREVADVRERFGVPERYLLWVGGLQHPHPTRQLAKLAATPRELPLVLAGPTKPWAHELPHVTLTGLLTDDELAALYSGAHALVVPSDHEGFGLPAVEALACGTPVVACEVPALCEVLGERATFVPRGDMRALIDAAERATRPAPPPLPWTWEDAARATWEVYARAIAPQTKPRPQPRPLAPGVRRRPAGPAGLEPQ
jgi:glycosyltransferase involved in cell wall biosynthesis